MEGGRKFALFLPPWASKEGYEVRFLKDNEGTVSIEYVAVGALAILLLVGVFSRLYAAARERGRGTNAAVQGYLP